MRKKSWLRRVYEMWVGIDRIMDIQVYSVKLATQAPVSLQMLPSDLHELFLVAREEVQEALRRWINPWVPSAQAYIGPTRANAEYQDFRHQIWVNRNDVLFIRHLEGHLQDWKDAQRWQQSGSSEPFLWEMMSMRIRSRMEQLHQAIEKSEYAIPFQQTMWEEWFFLESLLIEVCEECHHKTQHQIYLDEVEAAITFNCELLSSMRQSSLQQMRQLFVHEAVHAEAAYKKKYRKGLCLCILNGMQQYREDIGPRLYNGLNEAITQWFAASITDDFLLEDGSPFPTFVSLYPDWIIRDIIEYLNEEWDTIADRFPTLCRKRIFDAEDLVEAAYCGGPRYQKLLRQVINCSGKDEMAFAKVAQACERFIIGAEVTRDLKQESLNDLGALAGKRYILPEEINLPDTSIT